MPGALQRPKGEWGRARILARFLTESFYHPKFFRDKSIRGFHHKIITDVRSWIREFWHTFELPLK